MRRALQIITFVLMVLFGLQACAIAAGGELASELSTNSVDHDLENLSTAGAAGMGAAFMWLLAGAFLMSRPLLSAFFFFVAAGVCLGAWVGDTPYEDLRFWGVASIVLAGLAAWPAENELTRERRAAPRPVAGGDRVAALAKLAEMRESGALTEDEFTEEKERLRRD